jgi:hypothetical protein
VSLWMRFYRAVPFVAFTVPETAGR